MEVNNRYDFVLFFDVQDGNPNGDPDAGNSPRVDAETGHGLVTDVCIKRKIRNYVDLVKGGERPYEIYIKEKAILSKQNDRVMTENNITYEKKDKNLDQKKKLAREKMCELFYDIRTFGAVMVGTTNHGQIRGPVQFTFARSLDRIDSVEHSITRMAVTNEGDRNNNDEATTDDESKRQTMGRKHTIPYGLYRIHGFISAPLAKKTRFSQDDLDLLWNALEYMFEHDRSAARGLMTSRRLVIFKHASEFGNTSSQELFERVTCEKKHTNIVRNFSDYSVKLDNKELTEFKTLVNVGGE